MRTLHVTLPHSRPGSPSLPKVHCQLASIALLAILGSACGGENSDGGGLGPTDYDVSGTWYFHEVVSDPGNGLSCTDSAVVVVTQTDAQFTAAGWQEGSCTGPGGTQFFADSVRLNRGRIAGSEVSFKIDPCPYSGDAVGAAPDSIIGTLDCRFSSQGIDLHLQGVWRLDRTPGAGPDQVPPAAGGWLETSLDDSVALVDDSLTIVLQATDNAQLTWLGYQLSGTATGTDSVPATGTAFQDTLRIKAQAGWQGTVGVTAFARDAAGHRATTFIQTVRIAPKPSRPTVTVNLAAPAADIAYDATRGRLYASQPGTTQVAVVDLSPVGLSTPITLLSSPAGLDLSAGGDSLIVALGQSVYFAVANLVTGTVDTVRLNFDPGLSRRPDRLRVTANNKLFVSLTFAGSGFGGQVLEYDLVTGSQLQRTDVGITGQVTERTPLARSGDREEMLLLIDDSCCPLSGQVYSSTTNLFSARTGTVNNFFPSVSGDQTGSRWLIGNQLFLTDLTPILALSPPGYSGGPTALAPDALHAYLGVTDGYLKVRITDRAVVEHVILPFAPQGLWPLPDGKTLAVSAGSSLMVVDLQ